jgi:hypothetical protein
MNHEPILVEGLQMIDLNSMERLITNTKKLTSSSNSFIQTLKTLEITNYIISF